MLFGVAAADSQRVFSWRSIPCGGVTDTAEGPGSLRVMVSKVPAVTVWFWVIKILCTTVGESFADWINMTFGVGLIRTALIFTVVLAVVLGWQLWLDRYVPLVYWLAVVLVSVTGTLYTDILTDTFAVPLVVSTVGFAVLLCVVFGIWYRRERTLSIHSITTLPRELFYWLAVLVTFALGTAAGDWTLELTGWGPGTAVLLPAALIAAVVIGWRLGANPVLAFWLAYILTRPLGANLGDWLGSPRDQHGLGVGVAGMSVIFLVAIAATVAYLSVTHADVMAAAAPPPNIDSEVRQRTMLVFYAAVAATTAALVGWAAGQPHAVSNLAESESAGGPVAVLAPGQSATAHFPSERVADYRSIVQDTLVKARSGDQAGAAVRIADLETAWDNDQSTLQPLDETGWAVLDGDIDEALSALRADHPDPATETRILTQLLTALQ
jgi:uncharacterized membrane-anchored protein